MNENLCDYFLSFFLLLMIPSRLFHVSNNCYPCVLFSGNFSRIITVDLEQGLCSTSRTRTTTLSTEIYKHLSSNS